MSFPPSDKRPRGNDTDMQSVLIGHPDASGWQESGITPVFAEGNPGVVLTAEQIRFLAAQLMTGDMVCIPFPEQPSPTVHQLLGGRVLLSEIDFTLTVDSQEKTIPYQEFEMLRFFVRNREQAFSREAIFRGAWGHEPNGANLRTIDSHIKSARRHLKPYNLIYTRFGFGYGLSEHLENAT